MEFKAYKLSYYLNAQHSMDNTNLNIHAHTFNICLLLEDIRKKGFINFEVISDIVNGYMGQFSGKHLNEMPEFIELLPTIENIGAIFYEELKLLLMDGEYDLIQIEISENPLRVYSISDRLYLGTKPTETTTYTI